MYNCYNEGYAYLKNKYGFSDRRLTLASQSKVSKARNKKEKQDVLDSFTDDNYVQTLNPITDLKDQDIYLLLTQYAYGIHIRKELYFKLLNIKNQ